MRLAARVGGHSGLRQGEAEIFDDGRGSFVFTPSSCLNAGSTTIKLKSKKSKTSQEAPSSVVEASLKIGTITKVVQEKRPSG